MVEDGCIFVERGTHRQLLAENGLYADLHRNFATSANQSSHSPCMAAKATGTRSAATT